MIWPKNALKSRFCWNFEKPTLYVGKKKPEDITTHCMDYPMNEITAYLIQASLDVYGQNFKQAFTAMNAAVGAFHRFFADQKEQNWTLPILYQMLLDLQSVQKFWFVYLKMGYFWIFSE